MYLGPAIRRIRERKGIKLKDLAAALGEYDPGNLSRIERGEQGISMEFLARLPEALGMPLSEIFREAEGHAAEAPGRYEVDVFESIARELNTRNLATAATALEMAMPSTRFKLTPEDRARLIEELYRIVRDDGSIDVAAVAKVVQPIKAKHEQERGKKHGGKRHKRNP